MSALRTHRCLHIRKLQVQGIDSFAFWKCPCADDKLLYSFLQVHSLGFSLLTCFLSLNNERSFADHYQPRCPAVQPQTCNKRWREWISGVIACGMGLGFTWTVILGTHCPHCFLPWHIWHWLYTPTWHSLICVGEAVRHTCGPPPSSCWLRSQLLCAAHFPGLSVR